MAKKKRNNNCPNCGSGKFFEWASLQVCVQCNYCVTVERPFDFFEECPQCKLKTVDTDMVTGEKECINCKFKPE